MPENNSIQGTWTGRLVDVQGFEGEITFDLKQEKKGQEVYGSFDAAIGVNHTSMRQRGAVKGSLAGDRLDLIFETKAGDERPVVIRMAGQVQPLKEGGAGLKATYEVSARGFSPLQGGILCASAGRTLTSAMVAPDRVVERTPTVEPPKRAGASARGAGRAKRSKS